MDIVKIRRKDFIGITTFDSNLTAQDMFDATAWTEAGVAITVDDVPCELQELFLVKIEKWLRRQAAFGGLYCP